MEQRPDVIVISATHEEDLPAQSAELLVTVQASSLVTGSTALTNAKEVSKLVDELVRCRLSRDDVELDGINVEASSGFLGTSSAAAYRLRVRCTDLGGLPSVLGAVTSTKNARLEGIRWRYADKAAMRSRWLQSCVTQASAEAAAVAEALGVQIVGVHRVTEQHLDDPELPLPVPAGALRRGEAPIEMGFELARKKRSGVKVTVEYRIDGSLRSTV